MPPLRISTSQRPPPWPAAPARRQRVERGCWSSPRFAGRSTAGCARRPGSLCLQGNRRPQALRANVLRDGPRSHAALPARRRPCHPPDQRSPAQPRREPAEHLPSAPLQYDELSFSRLAREPRRHRRQRHAQHGARAELRRRDRHPRATIPAAPTGITRITTAGPTSRMASGMVGALIVEGDFDAVPEIARAQERMLVLSQVVFDHLGNCGGFRHGLSRNGHALLLDQRATDAHDRDASGRGAALARAARRLSGHPPGGAGAPRAARDCLRRNPLPRVESQETMVLAPGQRADVLVQAGAPGT